MAEPRVADSGLCHWHGNSLNSPSEAAPAGVAVHGLRLRDDEPTLCPAMGRATSPMPYLSYTIPGMGELCVVEIEPEVRQWLANLSPQHYRQAEEKAELEER